VRVIVDSEGKLEVQRAGEVVGVQVVDADGNTRPWPLAEVVEEVTLASGAVVQVVTGGAPAAQPQPAVQADNGGGEDWEALVGRLRVKGRAAMEAAKSWEARASHFQAVAVKLELQLEEQATGRGQLVSLPVGRALVPMSHDDDGKNLAACAVMAAGLALQPATLFIAFMVSGSGAWRTVWACERVVLGALCVGLAVRLWAWARGKPARPWVPVITTPEGQYRVRVDRQGEAQVLARRGAEESWRPARSFVGLPPAPAVDRRESV